MPPKRGSMSSRLTPSMSSPAKPSGASSPAKAPVKPAEPSSQAVRSMATLFFWYKASHFYFIRYPCSICLQDGELPITVEWEFPGPQASFALDSNELVVGLLNSRKAERYSSKDCLWHPIVVPHPFEVKKGEIVMVRAVGLRHCPRQFEYEIRVDNQYMQVQSCFFTPNMLM